MSPTKRGLRAMHMVFPSKCDDPRSLQNARVVSELTGAEKNVLFCNSAFHKKLGAYHLLLFSVSAEWLLSFPDQLFLWNPGVSWEAISRVMIQISWCQ